MEGGPQLDAILSELNAIQSELADLPSGDFVRRAELIERRSELRESARSIAARVPADKADLTTRLAELRRELDVAKRGRLSQSAAASTGYGGGIDPYHVQRLNQRMDEATGVAELQRRIADLERRLEQLDSD